ncbi:MAG: hypothetical protein MHMPM18_003116 [Marteilia pararefringens]
MEDGNCSYRVCLCVEKRRGRQQQLEVSPLTLLLFTLKPRRRDTHLATSPTMSNFCVSRRDLTLIRHYYSLQQSAARARAAPRKDISNDCVVASWPRLDHILNCRTFVSSPINIYK